MACIMVLLLFDQFAETALHLACENDQEEIVKVLLTYGASVDDKTDVSTYDLVIGLQIAYKKNHMEVVKVLLDKQK